MLLLGGSQAFSHVADVSILKMRQKKKKNEQRIKGRKEDQK